MELVDSYSEANQDDYYNLYGDGNSAIAQSFTSFATKGGILVSCKFDLAKVGSPTGNAYAKVYAHSGTYGESSVPTGSPLATSDPFDVSTLTTTLTLKTLTFSGSDKIKLAPGTYYCVVIEFTGGDFGNNLKVGIDLSSPTHDGNLADYVAEWVARAANDVCFYVYGQVVGPFPTHFRT